MPSHWAYFSAQCGKVGVGPPTSGVHSALRPSSALLVPLLPTQLEDWLGLLEGTLRVQRPRKDSRLGLVPAGPRVAWLERPSRKGVRGYHADEAALLS